MSKDQKNIVLVVILNFNGWKETIPCIESVLSQSFTGFHILLIDNGSADNSLKKLTRFENHEKITYLKEPKNLGFAGGVNIGIRHAIEFSYEYTVLLNNDASLSKNWLEILVNTSVVKNSSTTTGLLLSADGKFIESTGDSYSKYSLPFPRQRGEKTNNADESDFVFGGTAGASLYKTSLFKDIGLFDEKFFAYFEDTDISYRSQLAGHKAYYEKSAIAYHEHGTTSNKIPGFTTYQTFKNLPMLFWKNVPAKLFFGTALRFFSCYVFIYLRTITRGQFMIATKGVLKSFSLLPHSIISRSQIQKTKKVSSEYLQSIIYQDLPPSNKRYARKLFKK